MEIKAGRVGTVALLAAVSAMAMALAMSAGAGSAAAKYRVTTMKGYPAPGTPARYNKVRVLKQGPKKADHVLVLIPGTSAGAAYFKPMASAMLKKLKGWQIWSIERRENLLEDHSMLDRYIAGKATDDQAFDYYLRWLGDRSITHHFEPLANDQAAYAKQWGMRVAVGDINRVVNRARKHHRKVVLGGHSLGGSITTAYATWNFHGRPGAKKLSGLVFIDGASGPTELTPEQARQNLADLDQPDKSPFLDLIGLGLPWSAGVFNALGSNAALYDPDQPSLAQSWPLFPAMLKPPVPTTNLAQYGYAVDTETGPESLSLVQMHVGHLAASGDPRGWVNGELGSAKRGARVFAGFKGMDGSSWYHPLRLTIDSRAVDNGIRTPAQKVYGLRTTFGKRVHLPMYSFDTSLGGGRVADSTRALAKQSHVPKRWVRTVKRVKTYAHIDPIAAYPKKNAFIKTVVPFLKKKVR